MKPELPKPTMSESITIVHGEEAHRVGDPCKTCEEVTLEWPYVKSLISQALSQKEEEIVARFISSIPHKDNCALYKGEQTDECDCGIAEIQMFLDSLIGGNK
jgi:hypothetical protein